MLEEAFLLQRTNYVSKIMKLFSEKENKASALSNKIRVKVGW